VVRIAMTESIPVADAKRRFSELIDRASRGEQFVVTRHGAPALGLVPPGDIGDRSREAPLGLAAGAGALADWDDLDHVVEMIYQSRQEATDRDVLAFE
jgi:prevent-host-death family protein